MTSSVTLFLLNAIQRSNQKHWKKWWHSIFIGGQHHEQSFCISWNYNSPTCVNFTGPEPNLSFNDYSGKERTLDWWSFGWMLIVIGCVMICILTRPNMTGLIFESRMVTECEISLPPLHFANEVLLIPPLVLPWSAPATCNYYIHTLAVVACLCLHKFAELSSWVLSAPFPFLF